MAKLSYDDVMAKLTDFEAWMFDEESEKLVAGFEFDNFTQAIEFVNNIAELAEQQNHHPDLLLHDYKFVTVFVGTHEEEGITDKDFTLIKAIEDNLEKE